jgi:hypothetical protein
VSWSLNSAVPGGVVVVAILVVFSIRFVVFVVVAHQVMEDKTVVSRNEIDARIRSFPGCLVEIRTARDPITKFIDL